MLIRVGFEFLYDVPFPVPMLVKLASFKNGVFWVTNAGEIKPSCNLA